MMLFKTIDYLLKATRYGSWGIGLLGIGASVILLFANLSVSASSALLFVATLLVSIAVSLLLAPSKLISGKMEDKRKFGVSGACLGVALVIAGAVYLTNGAFPEVNLLFI